MPSDRMRISPETYREYAISYKSLAALLCKTSEDTFVAKFLNGVDWAMSAADPNVSWVLSLMDDMYERGWWDPRPAQ